MASRCTRLLRRPTLDKSYEKLFDNHVFGFVTYVLIDHLLYNLLIGLLVQVYLEPKVGSCDYALIHL